MPLSERDRNSGPDSTIRAQLGEPSMAPGSRARTDELPAIAPSPSTSQPAPAAEADYHSGLQDAMKTTLRKDVPAGLKAIDPALASEPQLLGEALNSAKLIYVQECQRLRHRAPQLGSTLPRADDLTVEVTQAVYENIQACVEIDDSMAEDHWQTHQATSTETKDSYVESRNRAERQRSAAGWAQAARNVVSVAERAGSAGGLAGELKRRTEGKVGRDHNGRLGYLLMITQGKDVMNDVGVNADDHITGRAQGAGALSGRLTDIFSSAACHNDAHDMTKLLSHQRHGELTKRHVASRAELPQVAAALMSTVDSCAGPVKLVKLTVFSNHSVLYVIGPDNMANRHETIAAPDSTSILINDLIQSQISTSAARASIEAGLAAVCNADGVDLEYEVHQAATVDTVKERTQDQLRERMTQLGLGTAVGSWKMAELHDDLENGLADGESLQTTFGVAPIAKREELKLPKRSAQDGRVTFYELASTAAVTDPQAGTEYRVVSEGSWLRVKVDRIIADGQPAWMYPMLALRIVNVNPNLVNPVRSNTAPQSKPLAMWGNAYRDFNLQQLKLVNLKDHVFVTRDDVQWVVTQDDNWEGQGMTRMVTMRPVG